MADYSMRILLLELALLVRLVIAIKYDTALRGHAIPVDFYVFKGKDEKTQEQNVAPRTSMNVEPPDDKIGFAKMCQGKCPVFEESCGQDCTSPQMRWCRCIAEILVKDMAVDFGALLSSDSPPIFELGDYVEVSKGQDYFEIADGHSTLYSLMEADSSHPYARRSGRVAVWVANHVGTEDDPNSMLAGTTLLDQPLWQDGQGAGVLFHAQTDRSNKVLAHEVGHVVGFHHTAGPSFMHIYDHPECPKDCEHVEMHPLVFPSCERNIMGHWYDGPYCCPGTFLQLPSGESPSFLQLRSSQLRRQQCLPHDLSNYQEAHCCGQECTYSCPKKVPAFKFDTKEHKEPLAKILQCWLHLRTVPEPAEKSPPGMVGMMNATSTVYKKLAVKSNAIECVDYGKKLGTCMPIAVKSSRGAAH